jgi:hypothetical protein
MLLTVETARSKRKQHLRINMQLSAHPASSEGLLQFCKLFVRWIHRVDATRVKQMAKSQSVHVVYQGRRAEEQ